MNQDHKRIAIIAGTGSLPRLLSEEFLLKKLNLFVVYFSKSPPKWTSSGINILKGEFEKIGTLFNQLKANNVCKVIFAGELNRPNLDIKKADEKFLSLMEYIVPAMKDGDDKILRLMVKIFEGEGFEVIGAEEVLPSLLPPAGILTNKHPTSQDQSDIVRAKDITDKIGLVDVGQSSVVANGLCLGLETIQGTKMMLDFVKNSSETHQLPFGLSGGVLLKNIKVNQSRLIDFPVIGPETVLQVSTAKLNGIAIIQNNVFVLEINETISIANQEDIFISVIPEYK